MTISLSNLTLINDLKQGIISNLKLPDITQALTPDRIRMFHFGKEMKDKDCLFMYNVAEGSSILMMVKKD